MSWKNLYLHYDDDALAVFANVGLLRRARKDLENNKVDPESLADGTFISDGQQVTLDPQGIQKSRCDCSATGCCKHILAAVLWVQSHNHEQSADVEPESSGSIELEPLLPELLSLDSQALIKQNSKPDCRLAVKIVQDWQDRSLILDDQSNQLKIFIPQYEEPVIYIRGNGFQGILSSLPEKQQKALHLAVIAKLFIQCHQPWNWPEDLIQANPHQQKLSDDEHKVLETIQRFIHDMLRQGLSHISQSSAAQLHLLNMSARAEGLPRLANYLKRLSHQVKLLAQRHFTMDEGQVLRFIAQISAYLYQLAHANESQITTLRAFGRRHYDTKTEILSLMPIDAQWWQTQSGAIGATLSFWDHQENNVVQCSQARVNSLDTTFNRRNVWQTLAIWKQTADNLMRGRFELHAPRISDEGKLSASGESYAISRDKLISFDDYQSLKSQLGFTDWQVAVEYLSNLAEEVQFEPIVLHIASYEPLQWNEIEQCVIWPVCDIYQNRVFLRLNWQGSENNQIEELRFITQKGWDIQAISLQANENQQHLQLIPKTLWLKKEQGIELFYLDFDAIPRKKQASQFMTTIAEYMAKKQRDNLAFAPEPTLAQQITRPIFSVLETQGCTGRQRLSENQSNELSDVVRTLQDLGMLWFAKLLDNYLQIDNQTPESLLKLVYLCDQFERSQKMLPFELNN
ncbi:SWIM zinc finger family protein [Providencia rustigianii]|uniref:SWIM zinc finger family protein n=1 Tax=Providencia rustigianii TaxID=158850 RepID=UPI00223FBD1D|nr:SWIM zinc finger family protein [Providencia rustigianii]